MVSMHLSEEYLSQLPCKEECGSIPDPELYCYSSGHGQQPGAAYQSSTLALCMLPCCSVKMHFRNFSTPASPCKSHPRSRQGFAFSATCRINACSLFDPIYIKVPRKRCSFILLLTLFSVPVPLQPSSSSFFFSTFVTHTDKTTLSLSWKTPPPETSQELSCQGSPFRCWIHGDVC